MRLSFRILLLCYILSLASCGSWLSRRPVDTPEQSNTEASEELVAKSQYDQLVVKYENLLKRNEELEERIQIAAGKDPNQMKEVDDQISPEHLAQKIQESSAVETVDVFEKSGTTQQTPVTAPLDKDSFEDELSSLRKAQKALAESKYDGALKILKVLEQSKNSQIKIRAKFYIGELLFRQQEFDLAMQVYEEILTTGAHSGVVVKVLGRLVACAEKLKLAEKQERYYSLLHDFFEEG